MSEPIPDSPAGDTSAPPFPSSPVDTATKPGLTICGYKIPLFAFLFGFNLPPLPIPPRLPIPSISISISCDEFSNPVKVNSGIPYGGGRTSQTDPDPDDTF